MKSKTSITLSKPLISAVDRRIGHAGNRSAFIEKAVETYLSQLSREEINRRDIGIINAGADRLNREAEEVLAHQISL